MPDKPSPSNSDAACSGPGSKPVPLTQLREGDRGWLHAANLCCEDCDLLNAMGMTEQCEIRVCQRGEPCIVQVNTTRLGLSGTLARNIMVSLSKPSA